MGQRRTFAPEMKREICRQLISGEKRLAQICRAYALAASVVIRWLATAGALAPRVRSVHAVPLVASAG